MKTSKKTLKYNFQLSYYSGFYYKFMMTGFMCQMPAIFRKGGTLTPPAFKSLCHRGNVRFFWGTGTLCAVAWVIVAQCHLVKGIM